MEILGTTQTAVYSRPRQLGFKLPQPPPISSKPESYRSPSAATCASQPNKGPCHCRQQHEQGLTCQPPRAEQFCSMQTTRLPSLLPPLRTALYARYNTGDWHRATEAQFRSSDYSLKEAVRYRSDLSRIMQDKHQLTRTMQADSRKNLGHRLADTHYWRTELDRELELLLAESCRLKRTHERLCRAVEEITQATLRISQECLYHREKRMGIDLVHDIVETKLLEEIAMIKCCKEKLKQYARKFESQLQANRNAQHELEKDLTDKKSAQDIDRKCFNLRNTSEDISYFLGIENIDGTVSVPESWGKFSDRNILHSQCQRAASSKLREGAENLLETASTEMWRKFNEVNVAFTKRISEITETKNLIQVHLAKTLQETCQTENAVLMLKNAIKDKEFPKKVAQTCLEERTKRPNVELCRDIPQLKLVHEVHTIDDSIQTLRIRLNEAQDTLQLLALNRSRLQHELTVKTNSLYIDTEQCMGLRKTFPSTPRLIGFT